MTTLNLSSEQTETLKDTLTVYVSNLRMEIAGTDKFDYRESLKQKETTLKEILEML